MEKSMDRRQKKTREAVFGALCELLSKKQFHQITVGEIIEKADVGRATFYAHFETKDYLLKALCEELFCHIFDAAEAGVPKHKHIFDCDAPSSVILHLLRHLQNNDYHILQLLASENDALFMGYFKENLKDLIRKNSHLFESKKAQLLPEDFWIHHVSATFVEALRWWIESGMKESPEELAAYLMAVL